MGGLSVL